MEFLKTWWKSLFPHRKWVKWVLTALVIGAVASYATTARSDSYIVSELGAQYLRGPAATLAVHIGFDGPKDSNVECGIQLAGQTAEVREGVMAGQCLLIDGFGKFDIGIGLAYLNHTSDLIGSNVNAALMIRYRLPKDFYIALRHWSNAGTTDVNVGMDFITVGKRF